MCWNSLPLITFRAYWPLCQPYEFTNSFFGLPRPFTFYLLFIYLLLFSWIYYFIHWAFSAHLLLLCHLLFFVGLLTIIPAIPACWSFFTIFSSYLLHIVELLLPLDLLSKVGINNWLSRHIVYNFIYEWV